MKSLIFAVIVASVAAQSADQWTYCRPVDPPGACTADAIPVCGVKATGVPQTYGSACQACRRGVVAYKTGNCPSISNNCSSGRTDCRFIKIAQIPSCGFRRNQPFANSTWQICCLGQPFDLIIQGPCPNPSLPPPPPPPTTTKYKLCSTQNNQCQPNSLLVCAIPNQGLPVTLINSCSVCSIRPRYYAFSQGVCQVKTCPRIRPDCTTMRFPFIPSCGFYRNRRFENVENDMCCAGTRYEQVIQGRCPEPE